VDEALAQLEKVIQIDGQRFPNAYMARGGIRAERRQFPDALKDFDKAIEIYRQQIVFLDALARADDAKGWKRKADGERKRKVLLESALEKALVSKKAVESQGG